jgi:hypothetical protein
MELVVDAVVWKFEIGVSCAGSREAIHYKSARLSRRLKWFQISSGFHQSDLVYFFYEGIFIILVDDVALG